MANSTLSNAKAAKKDEFYTMFYDIETEMEAYLDYNPDVFRGKTVLLPCDDPEWSNFTKYFAQNFEELGLKKLISTSYAINSKVIKAGIQTSFLETASPKFDKSKTNTNGKIFVLEKDTTGDGKINLEDLEWDYLEGDGDFRSEEVKKLRNEADIIVTNPPFSLFREFLAWIVEADKQFIIIGNINCVTYKEVFPLLKDNKVWMGCTIHSGDREFGVPDEYPLEAAGCRIDENGKKYIRVKGVRWYTNIDHGSRHDPLSLMSMADNIKYSKHKEIQGKNYQHYDNYDAIEIPYSDAIPCDYEGMIGVPITFFDKYCPEQFEIVGITKTWFGMANKVYPKQIQVSKTGKKTIVTKLNDGPVIELDGPLDGEVYYIVEGKYYTQAYARILIRKKQS
ncbi:adenine-specific methyltransferase EcoRI family protein [Segatella copri]|uniref:adenine-specific methyltransferase EcoRI family protein n=1 Tax=Segatella copri TaxID=165179 RepID=UPI0019334186|nr:adenine-specific methyltransferase EcoRI family protein [Segatella copri]MBM0131105.1 DNA methyltransferase [Segatella copri]